METSENIILAQKPGMSNGKLRPCGPLLQLVIVALQRVHSVSRSVDADLRSKRSDLVTLLIFCEVADPYGDTNRRVVWLGRHPAKKISAGPNDKLIQVGNLEKSVRVKACLTVFQKARNAELKDGPSGPLMRFNGAQS